MIPLYSTAQIREIDNIAIKEFKIPGILLMENASSGIYRSSILKLPTGTNKIAFICGKGNNGGDGFAAARHFYNNGYQIAVIYMADGDELKGDAATNFNILQKLADSDNNIILKKFNSLNDLKILHNYHAVFEALLGSGAEGGLKEPYLSIIKKINEFNCFKVAVDIPAGLNSDTGYSETALKADLTITLAEYKKGLFVGSSKEYTGEVIKESIGISSSLFNRFSVNDYLIEPEDVYLALPVKNKTINKYSAGNVLTIAGSGSYPGAAALTSSAALKIGAGASVLAFPNSVKPLVHSKLIEVVVEGYEDEGSGVLSLNNLDELEEKISRADVIAVGPGLGRRPGTSDAVVELLKSRTDKLFVIDADALFALKDNLYKEIDLSGMVLTPHMGEFARLLNKDTSEINKDVLSYGRDFAGDTGCYLVLKGAPTIIFTPEGDALINTTGNPGLAKFGTGDVLTGIIAGLAAQLRSAEEAAVAGVYLHSLTADIIADELTEYCYTAEDLLNNLHKSVQFLRKSFV